MINYPDKIRVLIEVAELSEGKRILLRFIRNVVRFRIYKYAGKNYIMDFEETILVPQRHRDERDRLITLGTNFATQTTAALDTLELLSIFDIVAANI